MVNKIFPRETTKENTFKSVQQKEGKKRIVFFLKLLLFVGIISLRFAYPEITEEYRIKSSVIDAALFYITAHIIISFSRLFLVFLYIRRSGRSDEFKDNFILGISQIANILSFITLVFAIFMLFDINAREFFTSISIAAAAIAIISKDYISNMINGMIIMFSDQLSLEDYIKIGAHKGKIINISLLNIHLLNDDDDLVYVPNNAVLTSDIINYTKRNIKKITIDFELNQTHIKEYANLSDQFLTVINTHQKYVKEGSPVLKVVSIQKDAINFKYQFLLTKRNREIEKAIRRKINDIIIETISK